MSSFICCYAECHYAERHYAERHYAERHYAECRYGECRGASHSKWPGKKISGLIMTFF